MSWSDVQNLIDLPVVLYRKFTTGDVNLNDYSDGRGKGRNIIEKRLFAWGSLSNAGNNTFLATSGVSGTPPLAANSWPASGTTEALAGLGDMILHLKADSPDLLISGVDGSAIRHWVSQTSSNVIFTSAAAGGSNGLIYTLGSSIPNNGSNPNAGTDTPGVFFQGALGAGLSGNAPSMSNASAAHFFISFYLSGADVSNTASSVSGPTGSGTPPNTVDGSGDMTLFGDNRSNPNFRILLNLSGISPNQVSGLAYPGIQTSAGVRIAFASSTGASAQNFFGLPAGFGYNLHFEHVKSDPVASGTGSYWNLYNNGQLIGTTLNLSGINQGFDYDWTNPFFVGSTQQGGVDGSKIIVKEAVVYTNNVSQSRINGIYRYMRRHGW